MNKHFELTKTYRAQIFDYIYILESLCRFLSLHGEGTANTKSHLLKEITQYLGPYFYNHLSPDELRLIFKSGFTRINCAETKRTIENAQQKEEHRFKFVDAVIKSFFIDKEAMINKSTFLEPYVKGDIKTKGHFLYFL